MGKMRITLAVLEEKTAQRAANKEIPERRGATMEFHINHDVRREYGLKDSLFSLTGNVILADMRQTRELAARFNVKQDPAHPDRYIRAGHLYAMGLIDEILHYVVTLYCKQVQPDAFDTCLARLESKLGENKTLHLQNDFSQRFPPKPVYTGEKDVAAYLQGKEGGESCRALSLEETMLLSLANLNPAFSPFKFLFDDKDLARHTVYPAAIEELKAHFKDLPTFGPDGQSLWDMLRAPALASPDSLMGQLEYMRKHWGLLISQFMSRLLIGLDVIKEEEKPFFSGPGPSQVLSFAGMDEYERFSPDQDWMPKTVLIAKSTLVWLFQLSQKYEKEITRLDQIPDEELDELARRGFTGLWLIGVWERSNASRTIKQWTGNPEAAASAYSLYDYDIAGELGGWGALGNLRERCMRRGIRLGSDMVPNHTGIDSRWLIEHPDRFLQLPYPPFPTYNYNCGNLSGRDDVTVQIEEHYFSRSDAAVVFKRIDNRSGETRFIYHGNDGTSMPWNDTAQIDFLNPEAREAVIRTIAGVCQQFSIVRFDAAMTLAKRHIQRLWFPVPGHGGAIASRAEHAISNEEFNARIPDEFWREVVDRCAVEAPNTLLLAEAFWMMEGYFVRTLGMHRVYNSAFMNMLKNEENAKYRATIKNTLEFDPEILKRFVNFMNNPDEETAVAQFGKGDKYFGICTLLVTMPGLPMFGHGQIEGFEEKYGMEYRRSYRDEQPDGYLVDRHEREIFPLMKKRYLFSGSANFRLYDLYSNGTVNENVFAYSNRAWTSNGEERSLIFYNNSYYESSGWIKTSDPVIPLDGGGTSRDELGAALALHSGESHFTLLREQRSNLWFIRSSKALSENGFFVSLKGYEAQVYIDIHEIADDARGRWARLNHDLDGRGVPDPWSAILDIYLGELYYRFTELFKPEIVTTLHDFFVKGVKGSSAKNFIKSLQKPFEVFCQTASHFIDGADGKFDAWKAKDEKGVSRKFKPVNKKQLWDEFEAYLNRLIMISEYSGKRAKDVSDHLLGGLADHFRERKIVCAAALGYGVISMLRPIIGEGASGADAVSLGFEHWQLERKLREQFRIYSAGNDETWWLADLCRAVLLRTISPDAGLYDSAKIDPGKFSAALIEENYVLDDFRRFIGVNVFDDVTWFNKEGFEATLFYGSLFCALESDKVFPSLSWQERIKRIAEICGALHTAEAGSGYRLEEMIELLSGEKGAKSKTKKTAQPAAKKKPAAQPKAAAKPAGKQEAKKTTVKPATAAGKAGKTAALPKTAAKSEAVAKPKVAAKPKIPAKPKTTEKPKAPAKSQATAKTKAPAKPKAAAKPKAVAKSSAVKSVKSGTKKSAPKTSKGKKKG